MAKKTSGNKKEKERALDRLKARQVRFFEQYTLHGNAVRAAVEVGYSKNYARKQAYLMARRVRVYMGWAVRALGINEVVLARELKRALRAKKPYKNAEGKIVFYPDWPSRLKANEDLRELLNYRPDEPSDPETGDVGVQIQVITKVPRLKE